jgi:hypothetical protein
LEGSGWGKTIFFPFFIATRMVQSKPLTSDKVMVRHCPCNPTVV